MVERLVFSDYGIEIYERNEKKYIRYDAGEIVVQIREIEITAEEAAKAQLGPEYAYEVIVKCEKVRRETGH
ncbi:hypothetical protein [Paenibacillus sp. R14(2021)]|uniref:hypothetical protein n=1 Tax=Paenibacillus sp. R14(2021) TaxID=2859228 RepID=UPI001C613C70|nr:hypothetical protein [Paenibacillus sp. R14(2021)]